MPNPSPEVIEQARWDTWRHHLGYILHSQYGWDRDKAAAYVEDAKDAWREYYDDGVSPEQAAAEDQHAGHC